MGGDSALTLQASAGKPLLFFDEGLQELPPRLGDHVPVKNSAAPLKTGSAYTRAPYRILKQFA